MFPPDKSAPPFDFRPDHDKPVTYILFDNPPIKKGGKHDFFVTEEIMFPPSKKKVETNVYFYQYRSITQGINKKIFFNF